MADKEFDARLSRQSLDAYGSAQGPEFTTANYRDYLKTEALITIADQLQGINDALGQLIEIFTGEVPGSPVESTAVSAQINPGGSMSTSAPGTGSLSVDEANGTVTLNFYDDKGDVTTAPDGTTAAFASDNPAALNVAQDPNNPLQGDLTPVAVGSANVTVTTNGTALDAGGNPIPDPASIAVNVVAGAAATEGLALEVPSQQ